MIFRLMEEDVSSHNDSFELLKEKASVLDQNQEFRVCSMIYCLWVRFNVRCCQVIASRYTKVRESAKQRRLELEKCLFEHKDYNEKCQSFLDWLAVAKEELERWSETSVGDKEVIRKKLVKIKVIYFTSYFLIYQVDMDYFA